VGVLFSPRKVNGITKPAPQPIFELMKCSWKMD
jgi:hypothetical protein